MITVSNLTKSFHKQPPLWENLSFDVPPHSITALTGPSGSGKSTLLNCIGALETPDSGSIQVFGTEVTKLGYRKARKYRRDYVGYLFQDYALIPDQTVYDNINLAARPNQIFPSKAMLTQVAEVLEQVGLAGYERRQVCELSGGEQQRVAIARLLVRPPKVVLADEPTGALDHDNSLRVIAHLRDLADGGASVVVATHSDLVAGSADQHMKVA
ncbi:ABC transporter ATP-binding protein [Corynebacterium matruchotii]|uniref:ABC transporter ATP-binding protein n=1 Tax=Corynebacterium matruchotii TaxID=43768 RepID=UPI0028EA1E9D|nr:ABC transporter ATP-binding protein [Corynebacterium matruchotii]